MISFTCPHCGQHVQGLVTERVQNDVRRHFIQRHPEKEIPDVGEQ